MVFILSAFWWMRIRGLWNLPDGRNWLWVKLGLALVGKAMLGKSLIQFSADGAAVLPPCNLASGDPVLEFCSLYARAIVSMLHLMLTSSNRTHPNTLYLLGILLLVPLTLQQALLTHAFTECSQTLTGKSDSVSYRVTAPFSWFLVHTRFCFCPPSVSVSPVLWKFCNQIPLTFKIRFPGNSQSFCWIPRLRNLLWVLKPFQQWENLFDINVLQVVDHLPGNDGDLFHEDSRYMLHLPGQLLPVPTFLYEATADPCLCMRPSDTHRRAWFSLLWAHCSFSLHPGAYKVLLVHSKYSLFPTFMWKSCYQIPLSFKIRFPGDSQCLCQMPRPRNLTWGLEPSQQWENFFGIIVLQFLGHQPIRYGIRFYCNCAPPIISLKLFPSSLNMEYLFYFLMGSC